MIRRQLFPPVRALCCFVALLALAASGCGKPVGNISGKATYQGKALPGGYVNFSCEGETPTVKSSAIQSDGSYSISGMPVGPTKITVQGVLGPQGPGTRNGPGEAGAVMGGGRQTVYVPPQYGNTDTSKLEYTVVSGSQTHDIALP